MPVQDADVKEITSRLDTVITLMAALFARDLKNNDAIVKLDRMQLSREQVANAVGVTSHNVAQVLYSSKKGDKKSKKAEPTKPDDATPEAVAMGETNGAIGQ